MEILLTKSQILKKIKKHLIEMYRQGNYSLFMVDKYMEIFNKKNDLKTMKYFYNLYMEWDNRGFMSIELGKKLEKLVSNPNYILGTHRTITAWDNENIYENDIIENILNQGLKITGGIMQGGLSKGFIYPSKNISPLPNMLHVIMHMKSSYKGSDTSFLFALPTSMVTEDLSLIHGKELQLYNVDFRNKDHPLQRLKPEFTLGFVIQEQGVYKFISKDDFLQKFNKNKQM